MAENSEIMDIVARTAKAAAEVIGEQGAEIARLRARLNRDEPLVGVTIRGDFSEPSGRVTTSDGLPSWQDLVRTLVPQRDELVRERDSLRQALRERDEEIVRLKSSGAE